MITDNTTENDLLAETIEELGQSLTELQLVINDIKDRRGQVVDGLFVKERIDESRSIQDAV